RQLGGAARRGRRLRAPPSHAVGGLRRDRPLPHRSQPARLSRSTTEAAGTARSVAVDITMPQLGETVTEGTVTRWLKQVGDQVAPDELIFEVSTDKVDSEVPAPGGGYLVEILVPEGETVPVGTRLAVLGDAPPAAGDGGAPAAAEAPESAAAPAPPQPEAPAAQAPPQPEAPAAEPPTAPVEAVETVAMPVPE